MAIRYHIILNFNTFLFHLAKLSGSRNRVYLVFFRIKKQDFMI
jgi:hypothetical protein